MQRDLAITLGVAAAGGAALYFGTRQSEIEKLATSKAAAVTYLSAYAAQRVTLAEKFGLLPGTDLPVTPRNVLFAVVWQWWADQTNVIADIGGADVGLFGAGFDTGGGLVVPATISTAAILGDNFATPAQREAVDAYQDFLIGVRDRLRFVGDALDVESARHFWGELAKLAVRFNTANLVPEGFSGVIWGEIANTLHAIPPALKSALAGALNALGNAATGIVGAIVGAIFSSPLTLVALGGVAFLYRRELAATAKRLVR